MTLSSYPTAARTGRLLLGMVALMGVYFGIYATVSGANVAYLAWFAHVPMIEKYFAGTWVWQDAIQRYGEHGLFGYNLLLLCNVKYFHLNVFFDIYLNVGVVTGVGLIAARAYSRAEPTVVGGWLKVGLFAPVAFALFSVTQQSSGAMETQVRLGSFFYLLAAYWIDRMLLKPRATAATGAGTLLACFCLILLAVLVFGTLYTFAGFPALMALCLYAMVARLGKQGYAAYILAALILAIVAYIRFYDLKLAPSAGTASVAWIERLSFSIRFLATYLGSATLGRTLWEDGATTSRALMLWNGLFVAAAYLYSLWLFWRTNMHRVTWLPLMMIAYTVGVGVLVLIGRGAMFGWDGGTNYWYAVHVKFALAGCLWIYAHALLQARAAGNTVDLSARLGRGAIISCVTISAACVVGLVLSNYLDWRRAPHVRRYFEAMIPYGLGTLDEMPVDASGQTPFRSSPAETKYALRVFRDHGLTFYRLHRLPVEHREHDLFAQGDATKYARLGPGWYEREGPTRWVSGRAQIQFHPGPDGLITIEGYIPAWLVPNSIVLSADGQEYARQSLGEGAFKANAHVPTGIMLTLNIGFQKHLIPRAVGLSEDQRDLGAIITRITTR